MTRLHDGRELLVRPARDDDVPLAGPFWDQVNRETNYNARNPDAPPADPEHARADFANPENHTLHAFDDGRLVGAAGLWRKQADHPWKRHTASFGMSVLRDYWGLGLGSALLRGLLAEADARGLARVEGVVRADNVRAVALYLKHGFAIEGRRIRATRIDGVWYDVYEIARLAPDA